MLDAKNKQITYINLDLYTGDIKNIIKLYK